MSVWEGGGGGGQQASSLSNKHGKFPQVQTSNYYIIRTSGEMMAHSITVLVGCSQQKRVPSAN